MIASRYICLAVAVLAANGASLSLGDTFNVSTAVGSGADIELTENLNTVSGVTTAGGNGTKLNMNARWNFANVAPAVPDKNEWAAMRFDLSSFADKASLSNVSLGVYMHRANANNNKNLHLYALAPGTTGEDWAEVGTTYETMPGFTFDANSTTNTLDIGGKIVDLGNFATTLSEAEGALALINPASLTTLVKGMGSHNLLTILMTTAGSTNGQWRVLTKEASGSETSVISGAVGDFAPFLRFDGANADGIPGDYNEDDVVDAADYTSWRDNLGSPNALPNDATNGVDQGDYTVWKNNFGLPGSGSGAVGSTPVPVPEPGTWGLLFVAVLQSSTCCRFWKRARQNS